MYSRQTVRAYRSGTSCILAAWTSAFPHQPHGSPPIHHLVTQNGRFPPSDGHVLNLTPQNNSKRAPDFNPKTGVLRALLMYGSLFRTAPGFLRVRSPPRKPLCADTTANRAFVTVMRVARSWKRTERIGHRGPKGIGKCTRVGPIAHAIRRRPERAAMNPYGGCRVPNGGT